jgi:apolipoprotein N-acyltransferase
MKKKLLFVLTISAIGAFMLTSPKWIFGPAAWIAPLLLILLNQNLPVLKSFLASWTILFLANLVGLSGVMPFPTIIFMVMVLWTSLLGALPYFLYRVVNQRKWYGSLAFPAFAVTLEFINSFQGGGTWGSVAYTQRGNLALIQLASITGIWGITFMVTWFSSLSAWIISRGFNWQAIRKPVLVYTSLMLCVVSYGWIRINSLLSNEETVKVGTLTASNVGPLLTMYKNAFGKTLSVDLATITQTSPEIQELNKAIAAFVENPSPVKYADTYTAFDLFQERLFVEADNLAQAGVKVISFSEAMFFTVKPFENKLIEKGKHFAREHHVFMILPIASFLPGKIEFGKYYMENKAIMIDDNGDVLNIFFKNKPVPMVEGSQPGDGNVPVQETPYGRIALSICYDADFPMPIRKAGANKASVLILPSGDWKEISPYHSDIARFRAIENGFSIVRPVSNAITIACNNKGQILGNNAFSTKHISSLMVDVPIHGTSTFYTWAGDFFAYICALASFGFAVFTTYSMIRRKMP